MIKDLLKEDFEWQAGYGAFSYGKSQIDQVCKYIQNQKIHHAKHSFKSEYINLLKLFEIDFKDEYLFEFYDWGLHKEVAPLGQIHYLIRFLQRDYTSGVRAWGGIS